MSKTITCKELGGVCDQTFTGNTLEEVMKSGIPHMMSDDAHQKSIMEMEERTGESQDQWMERMQREFDQKSED